MDQPESGIRKPEEHYIVQAGMNVLIMATFQDQEEEHTETRLWISWKGDLEALLGDKSFNGTEVAHVAALAACARRISRL